MSRLIALVLAVALTTVGAAAQALPVVVFGDSNAASDISPVTPATGWPALVATSFGVGLTNNAVNGAQAADQSFLTYSLPSPSAADDYLVALGTNDAEFYGNSSLALTNAYIPFLQDLAVFYATPTKVFARNMSLTGAWSNTGAESFGIQSSAPGSTASATVSGTAVYVSYVLFSGSTVVITVSIDGVVVGTISPNGVNSTTQLGRGWSPAVARFGGLAAGNHVVLLTYSSGSTAFIDWVAGSQQSSLPAVRVLNVIRAAAGSYTNGNSDANVATYNSAIAGMVAGLASDGLNVSLIDISSQINPSSALDPDGLHLTVAGQQIVASTVLAAINGPPPPPPSGTWGPQLFVWAFTPSNGGAVSYCLSASQPTSPTGACPLSISVP